MASMTGYYSGGLRTQDTHLKSGNVIITDAPPDNNGKGEAFSPTDLVCAALSSCMMTIMAMAAEKEGIDLTGLKSDILKIMAANPRKIAEIQITFTHPDLKATDVQKLKLERAGRTCPVALSLAEGLTQTIVFNW
ncbi:MAG: osmotically inducible protein OsmC [Azospira oryzae]|nr:MAG: osmotically inducible protein OsmC [Azospira oryzae]